jgi:hypothetical protein
MKIHYEMTWDSLIDRINEDHGFDVYLLDGCDIFKYDDCNHKYEYCCNMLTGKKYFIDKEIYKF